MSGPRSEKVTFPGGRGDVLAARLDKPEAGTGLIRYSPTGFTCNKDIFAASRIAAASTDHGIAVLCFDFTCLGASEGEFANTNFLSNIANLVAATEYMDRELEGPRILIGNSGAGVLPGSLKVARREAETAFGIHPMGPRRLTRQVGKLRR